MENVEKEKQIEELTLEKVVTAIKDNDKEKVDF